MQYRRTDDFSQSPEEIAEQGKALYNQREPLYRGAAQRSADSRRNQIRDLGSGVPDPDARAGEIRREARKEQDGIFETMEGIEAFTMNATLGKDTLAHQLYHKQQLELGLPQNVGQIRNKLNALSDDPRAMVIFQNVRRTRQATDEELGYIKDRLK
jgi:hypothetical protein